MADDLQQQILEVHANALAAQTILIGLMRAMIQRGYDPTAFEEAFDFAAEIGMSTAHAGKQVPLVVKAVDELRLAIIPKKGPKHSVE